MYFLVLLLFIWTVGPLVWMFISSISPGTELLTLEGSLLPSQPTFGRYEAILLGGEVNLNGKMVKGPSEVFKSALLNSFVVTSSVTLISLVIGGLAAYSFARIKFTGNRILMFISLFFQLLPPVSLIVPYYFMVRMAGMIDRLSTLVIIYTSFVLVYVIWVMTSYFKTIPMELEEAAFIDGCTRIGAFLKILIPAATPGFVAVGSLSFLMCWDEFLFALIFMNSTSSKTLPVVISEFSTQFGVDYGMMMTGGMMTTIIPLLLALFFPRYIVSGFSSGAVKG